MIFIPTIYFSLILISPYYCFANYRNIKIQVKEIHKYKWQKYRNIIYRNKEKQITEKNLQKWKNTNFRNIEIQITDVQKYKLQEYKNASEEEVPKGPRGI